MAFLSEPLWRDCLTTALQTNAHHRHCQYIQLATCDTAGVPDCRTLVFRGFVENSNQLIMHTDLRSQKIKQLRANSRGEICWYFSESREQFRLAGNVEIVASENNVLNEIRQLHWLALSKEARSSYYQPAPGSAIVLDSAVKPQEVGDKQTENEIIQGTPAETFALLTFKPVRVEHLVLTTSPHKRTVHQLNSPSNWCCKSVNP